MELPAKNRLSPLPLKKKLEFAEIRLLENSQSEFLSTRLPDLPAFNYPKIKLKELIWY